MLASPSPPQSPPNPSSTLNPSNPSNTTTRDRNASPSPSSRQTGAGGFLSSFGARLSRTFSRTEDGDAGSEASGAPLNGNQRSLSRGREALQSTGRGGFGNIRQASVSRDRSAGGPDDFSTTRGREREVPGGVGEGVSIYSTGRGGAGNLRSPSREPRDQKEVRLEKEIINNYTHNREEAPVSTGRGGLGNIASRSRSREPSGGARPTSRDPKARHATGRGGAGNIRDGDGYEANAADEVERGKLGVGHAYGEGLPHSTGRGGIANITEQEEPALERPSVSHREGEYGSTGRGGAGNLVRN